MACTHVTAAPHAEPEKNGGAFKESYYCCNKGENIYIYKYYNVLSVPFLGIGKLGGRLERHQLEGAPMSARTATTF